MYHQHHHHHPRHWHQVGAVLASCHLMKCFYNLATNFFSVFSRFVWYICVSIVAKSRVAAVRKTPVATPKASHRTPKPIQMANYSDETDTDDESVDRNTTWNKARPGRKSMPTTTTATTPIRLPKRQRRTETFASKSVGTDDVQPQQELDTEQNTPVTIATQTPRKRSPHQGESTFDQHHLSSITIYRKHAVTLVRVIWMNTARQTSRKTDP